MLCCLNRVPVDWKALRHYQGTLTRAWRWRPIAAAGCFPSAVKSESGHTSEYVKTSGRVLCPLHSIGLSYLEKRIFRRPFWQPTDVSRVWSSKSNAQTGKNKTTFMNAARWVPVGDRHDEPPSWRPRWDVSLHINAWEAKPGVCMCIQSWE